MPIDIVMALRTILPVAFAGILLVAAAPAVAQVVLDNGRTYMWLEPGMINASGQSDSSDAFATPRTRAIRENAFYTPVPEYQQQGYRCVGLMSVSFVGRVRHLHRGSLCNKTYY